MNLKEWASIRGMRNPEVWSAEYADNEWRIATRKARTVKKRFTSRPVRKVRAKQPAPVSSITACPGCGVWIVKYE